MNSDTKNIKKLIIDQPLKLDCGKIIKDFPLAYETYGTLNNNKSNAILAFHALTGDQFVTNINPITKREGWKTFNCFTTIKFYRLIYNQLFYIFCITIHINKKKPS